MKTNSVNIGAKLKKMEAGLDRMKRYTDHWVWIVVVPVFWIGFFTHVLFF